MKGCRENPLASQQSDGLDSLTSECLSLGSCSRDLLPFSSDDISEFPADSPLRPNVSSLVRIHSEGEPHGVVMPLVLWTFHLSLEWKVLARCTGTERFRAASVGTVCNCEWPLWTAAQLPQMALKIRSPVSSVSSIRELVRNRVSPECMPQTQPTENQNYLEKNCINTAHGFFSCPHSLNNTV